MNRKKIRIAYTDISLGSAERILSFVKDEYDFELTQSRDADFVIHSCGGMDVLRYPGVRIFSTGENVAPNFTISDYAIGFEKLQFGDRYLWMPWFKVHGHRDPFSNPRPDPAEALAEKTDFCAYVMSNTTDSDDQRIRIFELLSEYKQVSSGGRWRNNVGGPVPDKYAFQATHKFAIAFENCSHPGYLTEKFADAAVSNTVPIYWGDPGIGELFNPKAFINCHEYDSLEEVVERVKEIDQNDALYKEMLAEPWFPGGVVPESIRDETIAAYLRHIFEQPPEKAYRRNRGRWGRKWEKTLYDMSHRPHVQMFKNFRKQWRRAYHKLMPYRKFY